MRLQGEKPYAKYTSGCVNTFGRKFKKSAQKCSFFQYITVLIDEMKKKTNWVVLFEVMPGIGIKFEI